MKRLFALCAALAAIATPALSQATTYYVDGPSPAADDGNDGSATAPFRTIQRAADGVAPGDTVVVRPGVYGETVFLRQGGTAAAPVTFQGEPGAVIDGEPLSAQGYWPEAAFTLPYLPEIGANAPVDFVRITGFEIRNFRSGGIMIFANFAWDVPELSTGGRGIVIDHNVIHHCYQGLQVVSASLDPAVPTVVFGNLFYANAWTDVHVHEFAVVERNVALSNAYDQNIRSCGSYEVPGAVHRVANNVVANGVNGILVAYPGSTYVNNVVMHIHSQQIPDFNYPEYVYDHVGGFAFEQDWNFFDPSTVTIAYNDVVDAEGLFGNAQEWMGGPVLDWSAFVGATLSVDPLFVNYTADGTGDYHLTRGSPLIDAGDPATPVPAGGGAVVDIGAFEFGAGHGRGPGLKPWTGPFTGAGLGARSLEQKLGAAQRAIAAGRWTAARNVLEALVNEAKAQSGKHLTVAESARIVAEAQGMIGTLPPK